MPQYFTLGCLPPTLNEITDVARRNRYRSAQMKKEWTDYVARKCSKTMTRMRGKKVYLECIWFVKNFARDPDNVKAASKFIMDGLVNARKLEDDKLSIIQSPILHWFEKVSNHDSLVFIFYTEREWKVRQKLGIVMPKVPQPKCDIPLFRRKGFSKRKKTSLVSG